MPQNSLAETGRDWFAIQVWAGREQFSATHLRTHGFDVFCPCYQQRRRWSDRVKVVNLALFSGYVFCHMAPRSFGKIVTVPGVVRVVGDGQRPIAVPADEIEAIQRIVETRSPAEPWDGIHAGRSVRVELGPLQGLEGMVLTVKDRHRLLISVPMLQRSVAVEIDFSSVVVVERAVRQAAC